MKVIGPCSYFVEYILENKSTKIIQVIFELNNQKLVWVNCNIDLKFKDIKSIFYKKLIG